MELPLLLDGAMGTNLMNLGMKPDECRETWILSHRPQVSELISRYIECGSGAVYAPTYGANRLLLAKYGLDEQVERINSDVMELTKKAVNGRALIGGNMSSAGMAAEPYGDISFDELTDVYREQADVLCRAGADFIVAESMVSLPEARAALLGARETGLPVFITIGLEDDGEMMSGAGIMNCLITLQSLGAAAFGVNCSSSPVKLVELLEPVMRYARIPVIAKPNARHTVKNGTVSVDMTPSEFAAEMEKVLELGVQIVGGCCGTTPEHIAAVAELLAGRKFENNVKTEDVWAVSNETEVFFLPEDTLTLSDPIECTSDLEEDLIDIEDEGFNVIVVAVKSYYDAFELSRASHVSRLPVAIWAYDCDVLDAALRLYHGRAIVAADSDIPEDMLRKTAKKYGAVVV